MERSKIAIPRLWQKMQLSKKSLTIPSVIVKTQEVVNVGKMLVLMSISADLQYDVLKMTIRNCLQPS